MSDVRPWRKAAYQTGLAIVLVNPLYWLIGMTIVRRIGASDRVLGNLIAVGFLMVLVSALSGALGTGRNRWAVVTAASIQTSCWWFMAVGL